MMANLVSASFHFVSTAKAASFPVSTPIGKETRNEEQCQEVKRFKNRGLRPIITGNEWKRRSKKTELRFLAYVRISPNLVSNSFRLVSSFLEGMGE
mgnify:FL=1